MLEICKKRPAKFIEIARLLSCADNHEQLGAEEPHAQALPVCCHGRAHHWGSAAGPASLAFPPFRLLGVLLAPGSFPAASMPRKRRLPPHRSQCRHQCVLQVCLIFSSEHGLSYVVLGFWLPTTSAHLLLMGEGVLSRPVEFCSCI